MVVRDGAEVIPNPHVTVDGRDEIVLDGGSEGWVGVVLRAGAHHHVVVRAKGYVPTPLEITAAEAGGRRLETVTLTKARPGNEYDWPAMTRVPKGDVASVVGPDGVPFAVPFRLFASDGSTVRGVAYDLRGWVMVESMRRTSVSGVTTFAQSETTEAHRYVEVGGGLVETKRIDFDGTENEPGRRPPSIVLHVR